jgi:hypothetical protein
LKRVIKGGRKISRGPVDWGYACFAVFCVSQPIENKRKIGFLFAGKAHGQGENCADRDS